MKSLSFVTQAKTTYLSRQTRNVHGEINVVVN